MATHDYVIDNSTGANVRADLNLVLQAILSNNSSSSAPSTTAAYMLWVDTTANIVKIRNSANNAWINLFTTAGGVDVDAPSNFNEDVTFTGASANIIFDKSADDLIFNDNAKAAFGTSSDLTIFHDGSHSYIQDSGTGNLRVLTNTFTVNNAANSENMINATENGAVELYHDSSKKLDTDASGINVTGDIDLTGKVAILDNQKLICGVGDDLKIYHSGSNNKIESGSQTLYLAADDLQITNGAITEACLKTFANGAVELYYDNSTKFQTTSGGCALTGSLQMSNTGKIQSGSSGHSFTIQGGATLGGGAIKFVGGSNNGNLLFASGDSSSFVEKMRLEGNGNFFVGCTAEPTSGVSGTQIAGNGFQSCGYAGTGSHNFFELNNSNGNIGRINGNGSNTSYLTSSDYRLKENETAISDGITRLKTLKPYRFNFKTEPSVTQDGFFAHEVSSAVPLAVLGNKDATKEDGSIAPQGIDHSKLVPLLVAAVQELITKVETLEAA